MVLQTVKSCTVKKLKVPAIMAFLKDTLRILFQQQAADMRTEHKETSAELQLYSRNSANHCIYTLYIFPMGIYAVVRQTP